MKIEIKDPNIKRRMELARKSFHKGKWKNDADRREYNRLVTESMVLSQKRQARIMEQVLDDLKLP